MHILLVLPRDGAYRYRGWFRRSLSYAPLTLTTLAGLVPAELGARVEILDEGVQAPRPRRAHYDVVGVTCVTSAAPRAYALADLWRSRGALVVLGGAHPSLEPAEAARHSSAVVVGPAEEAWPALLRELAAGGRPSGIRYGHIPSVTRTLPPRRELLPPRRYLPVPTVMATRGCGHACRFCAVRELWDGRSTSRPVGEVVDEVRRLGTRRVLFLDPNIAADRAYALELLEALRPLRLRWAGCATVDIALDERLLEAALRSGLEGVLVGFETVSARSLAATRKGFARPDTYREATRRLHDGRVSVLGTFMLGFDEEEPEDMAATLDFIDEAGVDIPRFAVLTPFPGSELFAELDREGRILTRDLRLYDTQHVVFRPARRSPEALQAELHAAWRRTYSIARIARRVRRARSSRLLLAAVSLGFRRLAQGLEAARVLEP